MRTKQIEIFQFDELGESAKESARDWYRQGIETDEVADFDDWTAIAEILGVQIATHEVRLMGGGTRQSPDFYWSTHPAEASFKGRYSYAKQAPKRILAYAPQDAELLRIARALQDAQRKAGYRLTAACTPGGRNEFSLHVQSFKLSSFDYPEYVDNDALEEALRDFAAWIAARAEAQYEYLNSAESVDEMIRANEYEFTANGERA